jgi:clan AA aspartic protease (TIGR02281 family)
MQGPAGWRRPPRLVASRVHCYSRAMRKHVAGAVILALAMGSGLGWYARDRWGPGPQLARLPARPPSSLPAGAPESAHTLATPQSARSDAIQPLLQSHAFARAVDAYGALQAQADDTAVQRARIQLLAHARQLLAQVDYRSAIQLLQLYLQVDYRDVEARLLLAEGYRGEKDWRAAIEQLYEAKGQAYRAETLEQLTRRIRALVSDYAEGLKQTGDNAALLELYQDLTQLEPSYAPHFIGLAMAQLALGDNDAARQSLLLVAQDPEVGAQARELLQRVRVAATEPQAPETAVPVTEVAGIPLVRSGSHFLVDVRLGSAQQARLLIDTGASLTMLTPDMLQRRGVVAHATGKTGVFNTANGRVRAPIYRLDSLSVGDWEVSNLDVGVLELDDAQFDGLLGMNFLRHFRFFIDQNAALLRLSMAEQPN